MDIDSAVRIAAFEWLADKTSIHGDVLPRTLLEEGFMFQNERIHLVSRQGIFKPRVLDLPLSITTAPRGPYDDSFDDKGFLIYRYRGTDIQHRDNIGLRKIMLKGKPLVYLHGIVPGKYLAVWPVYIIGDDQMAKTFTVAVDEASSINRTKWNVAETDQSDEIRRAYITSQVKVRLHQRSFRERVLEAYQTQCALCRLRHSELLDAAHIIPDADPAGSPKVNNGIALCKFHHAAYDSLILTINPDYFIQIREDVLHETDGPLLQYGLKELHQTRIILPRRENQWPDRCLLEVRYKQFIHAA